MFNREGLRVGWRRDHEPKRRRELRTRDGPACQLHRIVSNATATRRAQETAKQATICRQEAA
jgi:hypothetical protein